MWSTITLIQLLQGLQCKLWLTSGGFKEAEPWFQVQIRGGKGHYNIGRSTLKARGKWG